MTGWFGSLSRPKRAKSWATVLHDVELNMVARLTHSWFHLWKGNLCKIELDSRNLHLCTISAFSNTLSATFVIGALHLLSEDKQQHPFSYTSRRNRNKAISSSGIKHEAAGCRSVKLDSAAARPQTDFHFLLDKSFTFFFFCTSHFQYFSTPARKYDAPYRNSEIN